MFLDTHLERTAQNIKPINFDMLVVAVEDESRQKMKFHHVEFGDLSSRSE